MGVISSQGISAEAIVLGMEGVAQSFSVDEENDGFRLAFHESNDSGSIHGRRIEWRGYPRPRGAPVEVQLANYRRLVEEEQVFATVNFAAGDATNTLIEISRRTRTPYLFPHSGIVPPSGERYLFASYPNLESEARIMFRFLAQTRGAKRIAIVHDPNVYGMFYVERLRRYADVFGYEFAGALPLPERFPGDQTCQLAALIDARPDAIFMGLYPAQAKAVMEAKAKLAWDGVMVSSGPLTDEEYLVLPNGKAEGTLGFCYYPDPISDMNPGMVAYRAALKRCAPEKTPNRYSLYGYVFGKLIVEGFKRAGRSLTRESYIDAMETITDWDAGGVMPDVTLSKINHHAQPAGFIGEIRNERFIRLSDWIVQ